MRMWKLVLSLIVVSLTGCASVASLYPVQGPLAETQPQVLKGTFTNFLTGHGTIKLTLPDGEVCKGEYTTIGEGMTTFSSGSGTGTGIATGTNTSGSGIVITQNDFVNILGTSFSVKNKQQGMATLIGNKGTIIVVDYFVDVWTSHGFGIAKDNKGNLYRVQF